MEWIKQGKFAQGMVRLLVEFRTRVTLMVLVITLYCISLDMQGVLVADMVLFDRGSLQLCTFFFSVKNVCSLWVH